MSLRDSIMLDPSVSSGQSVVRDTCVLVRLVLGYLAHGETTETILREFPSISEEDVRAVIAFASRASVDAREQGVDARGHAREQGVDARGYAREQGIDARGYAREQGNDAPAHAGPLQRAGLA